MMIEIHLRDRLTGERTVETEDYDWTDFLRTARETHNLPDAVDDEMILKIFEIGSRGDDEPFIEKIVERGTSRVIFEEVLND